MFDVWYIKKIHETMVSVWSCLYPQTFALEAFRTFFLSCTVVAIAMEVISRSLSQKLAAEVSRRLCTS
jgi:hypothetical protein